MIKAILFVLLIAMPTPSLAAVDWNESEIKWYEYSDGLEAMRREGKRGMIVVYSNRCGACVEYAKMFSSPDVVRSSQDIVLIKIDRDNQKALTSKYNIDGNYVPRTILLDSDGSIMPSPYKSEKYMYFLPPRNENYLARLMRKLSNN